MSNSKFLAGLLLGAAAGAAVAVLLSSDKGKEVMADIKSAAGKAGEELKEAAKRFESELSDLVEKGKDYAENLGKKAQDYAAKNNV